MKKRTRAAAIIVYNGKIITIYREKKVNEKLVKYYVIPGGGVEENETVIEAVKREIKEEIGIDIKVSGEYFYLENEKANEYFYIADYVSGKIGTGEGPEFTTRDLEKYGLYEVRLVNIANIKDINLLPNEAKEYIIKRFNI